MPLCNSNLYIDVGLANPWQSMALNICELHRSIDKHYCSAEASKRRCKRCQPAERECSSVRRWKVSNTASVASQPMPFWFLACNFETVMVSSVNHGSCKLSFWFRPLTKPFPHKQVPKPKADSRGQLRALVRAKPTGNVWFSTSPICVHLRFATEFHRGGGQENIQS